MPGVTHSRLSDQINQVVGLIWLLFCSGPSDADEEMFHKCIAICNVALEDKENMSPEKVMFFEETRKLCIRGLDK